MLIIKLLRYLQGYCSVEASGGFPERFINLCTKNRIPIWDIKSISGKLKFFCSVSYLDRLGVAAEKAGMTLNTVKEVGLKHEMKKHNKRKGLLAAAAFCVAVTAFMSLFVWSISVEGNDYYSDEEIYEAFEAHGVRIGALKNRIDTRSVSEAVVSELDKISWTKVNIRGCFAVIEVKEVIPKPDLFDREKPTNIVASDDGIILRNEVEVGSPAVKSGIAVTKGDLLVSAVLTEPDGSEKLVHSKAFVTARVNRKIEYEIPKDIFSQSEKKEKKELFFFGLEIPKVKNSDSLFESKAFLDNSGRLLPMGVFSFRENKYETPTTLEDENVLLLTVHRFNELAIESCVEAERIIDSSVRIESGKVCGSFVFEKNIGVEQEIAVE